MLVMFSCDPDEGKEVCQNFDTQVLVFILGNLDIFDEMLG